MTYLVLLGGLVLVFVTIFRERHWARERRVTHQLLDQLHKVLAMRGAHLQRAMEDIYVLRKVLQEQGVFDEAEFERSRVRLVEAPRRVAQERDQIMQSANVPATQVIIGEVETLN
ncbi:MAG: hypothetical protein R3C68_08950 [Myxococcota bacterium]